MLQKLFSVAQNKCLVEGADAIMMQELMLGGHLYLRVMENQKHAIQLYKFCIVKIFFLDS